MRSPAPRSGIQTQKKSGLVAQQIVNEIVEGELRPGDRLAPEAEMCAHYGVGRSTVREALRLLENQGVLAIKTGPGGGPVLTDFEPGFLAANLALHLQLSRSTFRDVIEARLIIEPAIAAACAEAGDAATQQRLRAVVEHGAGGGVDHDRLVDESADFHDIVAVGSGNPLFTHLLPALRRLTVPFVRDIPYSDAHRCGLVAQHAEITAAIEAGDPAAAADAMRADLTAFIAHAEDVAPRLLAQRVDWGKVNS